MFDKRIKEIAEEIKRLKEEQYVLYKNNGFPYIDIFNLSTNAGEEVEKMISEDIFSDLKRITNENFDLKTISNNKDLEIKLIRMMVKGSGNYETRSISILDNEKGYLSSKKSYGGNISTTTFQQVKPKKFDMMIGVVLFKDGFDIFVVPSNKISNKVKLREEGKIYLSGQHSGNNSEGQINYNNEILKQHYIFSIYNDGKQLYFFDRETKKVKEKYNTKNIQKYI